MEVTLSDDLQYGLQWMFNDSQRTAGALSGAGVLSTSPNGALGGALAGFSYTLSKSIGRYSAVLKNALAGKSLVKVISSPSLMVLDNHTAAIAVGNQQPVYLAQRSRQVEMCRPASNTRTRALTWRSHQCNAGNIVTMRMGPRLLDVGEVDLCNR